MKNYQEILSDVREKNPDLPFKEAQILASKINKEQKEAEEKSAFQHAATASKPEKKSSINPDTVEAAIRAAGVDKHSIQVVAKRFHPDFTMVKDGKDGVNTLVHLDGPVRVPRTGHFKIWI